jgi:hypothetical protein
MYSSNNPRSSTIISAYREKTPEGGREIETALIDRRDAPSTPPLRAITLPAWCTRPCAAAYDLRDA